MAYKPQQPKKIEFTHEEQIKMLREAMRIREREKLKSKRN